MAWGLAPVPVSTAIWVAWGLAPASAVEVGPVVDDGAVAAGTYALLFSSSWRTDPDTVTS